MTKWLPVPVSEIVNALERDATYYDADPWSLAASWLRRISDWEKRTLMCYVEVEPVSETVTPQ